MLYIRMRIMIKHGLMLFAIFLLAGCGLFAADTEIESGEVEQVSKDLKLEIFLIESAQRKVLQKSH